MPVETYELGADARLELDEAIGFLESQRAGRGFEFLEAVHYDIELLVDYPEAGHKLYGGVRSFALADWPYKIIYAIEDAIIVVWAIAHDSRRPGYWRKRLRR
ncbi:MAG: type II toxin-antitoxin system RelE/ParE family toxin [Acidobacteria bacterium]|nr:MAG: type II toxin-antitoxin system RelE/ParE family toxin [Acidobacteriota bacterium]